MSRAPTLAQIRREARRVFGSRAKSTVYKEHGGWKAYAEDPHEAPAVDVFAMKRSDAKDALYGALKAMRTLRG